MKKVGILGGTFDPPHIGHLIIADQVWQQCQLDEIWFMPNYLPPHKEKTSTTTNSDRIQMLKYAIEGHPAFKIELIEMERNGKSFTYDTIRLLKKREPDKKFYFIIGADMIEYLPNWHKIDQLMKLISFIGVNRPGFKRETTYPIHYVEIPSIQISSSMIRNFIAKGMSVKYLLPEAIIQYIEEHGLYGKK
ncbi:nicotinate-nucleotide adenylyltransferase [Fervidibacillus halotolerans]|uniref:Probable nicotinate-nucleotide adenylyltransferase n=1 Tax=Fervidibacillus halotolerans TaxID=2980027 RepID=A0A9E8LXS5_9BACI|nr:nicotinate-nucleotide adenylyltransferase [Fervidibacillus halotolerans]WAA11526.1 nicotinate-nucleotide adenylyltransferase [Fervidibacillus halotolerans]